MYYVCLRLYVKELYILLFFLFIVFVYGATVTFVMY